MKEKIINIIKKNSKFIKISWWVLAFAFIVIITSKSNLIDNSLAEGVTCPSNAILRSWICVCKDENKVYQWWACSVDPVNVCPPDATRKWKTCLCNDKSLVYRDKACTVDLKTQCEDEWWSYINQWCDFSQKNHPSADIPQDKPSIVQNIIESTPVIKTIVEQVSNKLKVLDLNSLSDHDDHVVIAPINVPKKNTIEVLPIVNTDSPAKINDNIWIYIS